VLANDPLNGKAAFNVRLYSQPDRLKESGDCSSGQQCNSYIEERWELCSAGQARCLSHMSLAISEYPCLPKRVLPRLIHDSQKTKESVSSSVLLRHCSWAPENSSIYFFFEVLNANQNICFLVFDFGVASAQENVEFPTQVLRVCPERGEPGDMNRTMIHAQISLSMPTGTGGHRIRFLLRWCAGAAGWRSGETIKDDIEKFWRKRRRTSPPPKGVPASMIGDYYGSCMNRKPRVNAEGMKPLKPVGSRD